MARRSCRASGPGGAVERSGERPTSGRPRSVSATPEDTASAPYTPLLTPSNGSPGSRRGWRRRLAVALLCAAAAGLLVGGRPWMPDTTPGTTLGGEPGGTLSVDLGSGSMVGLRGEPDGAVVLDERAMVPADQRPRAYADRRAYGVFSSGPVRLARAVTHVAASLTADVPANADAVLEVRGAGPDGRWAPWVEVSRDGAAAPLGVAAERLGTRLTLVADEAGAVGPRVRGATLELRADRWRLAALAAATPVTSAPTMRVWATREGLVGARTANGHVIEPLDRFVALPSRRVLNALDGMDYTVTIHYRGRTTTVPVWDLGPWNIRDNYWDPSRELFADLPRWMPQAQAAFFGSHNQGRDQFGRFITIPTALDIADGTFWEDLGMTMNDWVEATFNWVDAPSPPWVAPVTVVPKPTPTPVPKPKAASYNAPAASAPRLYLPVILEAFEGWTSAFVVKNPNAAPASGTIELYNRDGSLQATIGFALPAFATGNYAASAADGLPARFSGAGIVSANQPVAVLVHEDRVEMDRMAYPGQAQAASTLYAPLVIKDLNNWDTTIHVQNVDTVPADVQIVYVANSTGARTWTDTATIAPLGKRAFSQFQHPQLPTGFVGSAVIRALNGAQLAAVVNEVKTEGAAVSYPAPAGGAPTTVAPFVLRNYQGWSTGLQVQNLGSNPTTATVTYTRTNGPGTWTDSAVVQPGAAAVFYQPSHPQLPDDFMGTALVSSSDGAPLAVLVNILNPQSTAAMNYVASAPAGPTLVLPYLARRVDGWNTGVLVFNPNSVSTVVRVTYYDASGAQVGRDEDTIAAGGTRSYFQQQHATLADGFRGSAVIQSVNNLPLVAVASEVYSP